MVCTYPELERALSAFCACGGQVFDRMSRWPSLSSSHCDRIAIMCFSATTSFAAGSVLWVVGIATLMKAKRKSELPFAMIPLLFGVRQFIEGLSG